jgi:regulator of sigma E protease
LDQFLIAAGWLSLDLWFSVLQVAVGLGLVIFVHEFGHFAVAKLCGVKCEKFYLGFDIAGWKIAKFQWGETEYGIGAIPLGGYVKMLGQEDNPARLKEELEKAKQRTQETPSEGAEGSGVEQADVVAKEESSPSEEPLVSEADIKAAEEALFDPRSYLAQSVPRRMAIISAGVIMNLIFAVIMATVAFQMGVIRVKTVIGAVIPGGAAWQEGVEPGDRIVSIENKKVVKFRDVLEGISLGDKTQEGLPIDIERDGKDAADTAESLEFVIKPDASGKMPVIGVMSSHSTIIGTPEISTQPGSPAAAAEPGFQYNDKIIDIGGTPVADYRDVQGCLATHPAEMLAYTVERLKKVDGKPVKGETGTVVIETVVIEVAPRPMRELGLVMEIGEISAVQKGSPAAKAGIKVGDLITKIDGQSPGDPMTLPERLRRRAGETVAFSLVREEGTKDPINVKVTLRPVDWLEAPRLPGNPMSIPALGVAYPVLNRVRSTKPDSPAAKAGLRNGDVITEATIIPPKEQDPKYEELAQTKVTLELTEDVRNWPYLTNVLQQVLPGTTVELKWKRQDEVKSATLELVEADDWFNPRRGVLLQPLTFIEKGDNLFDSAKLGFGETCHATSMVYRFLQKIGSQISITALGGPGSIFVVAKSAADQGLSSLLIFLTLLSANLAVLNFLPIPLLDGGHMVFLAWEGIRGKPASENIQLALTYVGLAFILTLMVFVIGLDISRFVGGF